VNSSQSTFTFFYFVKEMSDKFGILEYPSVVQHSPPFHIDQFPYFKAGFSYLFHTIY
jgi:hypothetical protein